MRKSEFAVLRATPDLEAACHAIFQEGFDIMMNRGRRALSEGLLTVICVETFFGETCNGGLDQYVTNQSPTASACPDALRRVGLANYAAIIEQTLELCVNSPSLDEFGEPEDEFEFELDSDGESRLEELDAKFLERYAADKDEFRRHLFQYIFDHETEFVGRPKPSSKGAVKAPDSTRKPLLSKAEKRKATQSRRLEYNRKCRELYERIERDGFPCPHCGVHTRDIRFLGGNDDRDAYFICRMCSRSFGLDDVT